MNGSRILPRILTALCGLLLAPLAVLVLAAGSRAWTQYVALTFYQLDRAPDLSDPIALRGAGLILIGTLLLIILALTGVWSSAGLLVTTLYAVPAVLSAAIPALMASLWTQMPSVPMVVMDAIGFGLPVALLPITAAMGAALAIARRRPRAPAIGAVMGVVAVPVVLLIGAAALTWGYGSGVRMALVTFNLRLQPQYVALTLIGAALVVVGIVLTRWSPYALVLPGLAVPALGAALLLPTPAPGLRDLLASRPGAMAWTFLSAGGGLAVGALFLAFTVVLGAVRLRARRAARLQDVEAPAPAPGTDPASPTGSRSTDPGTSTGPSASVGTSTPAAP